MKQEKIYQIEVVVGICSIQTDNIKQASTMFRIGKSTSKSLNAKNITKGKINFDGKLICSCDQSALSTQRITLTLNVKNNDGDSRVGGIIFIPLNGMIMPINSYKVSQSADKNSTMEIGVTITQIGSNQQSQIKNSGNVFLNIQHSKNPKKKLNPELDRQSEQKLEINSLKVSNKNYSEENSTLNLKVKSNIKVDPKEQSKDPTVLWEEQSFSRINPLPNQDIQVFKKQIQILKQQKKCLKELLKLEMKKSEQLTKFIFKISGDYYQNLLLNQKNANAMIRSTISNKIDKKTSFNKTGSTDLGELKLDNKFSFQARNKLEGFQPNSRHTQTPNFSSISQNLAQLLKQSLNERNQSKALIDKLKKVSTDEKDFKTDRKLRSIKIKIQKSIMQLLSQLNQNKPIQKDHIMKHKQAVNKIMDQLVICQVN